MHCLVVRRGEVLHEIIREIFGAWSPNYLELPLTCAVSQPVKSHVDRFEWHCLMVSLRMSSAHLLSVRITVGG